MSEFLQGWKRTDYCTHFTTEDVGREVTLMGWVQTRRDLGALIFVDLRDRTGIMQVVFNESLMDKDFAKAEDHRLVSFERSGEGPLIFNLHIHLLKEITDVGARKGAGIHIDDTNGNFPYPEAERQF